MAYLLNEPIAADFLSVSQPKLATNTNDSDASFGTDHFAFSDLSANNGKHNIIQSVANTTYPTTTVDPMTYAFSLSSAAPSSNIPTLLFTQGVSDVQPTPLTRLTSDPFFTLNPTSTQTILDFTNSPYCYGFVTFTGTTSGPTVTVYTFFWNGSSGTQSQVSSGIAQIVIKFTGSVLGIFNSTLNPYLNCSYTLEFQRIQLS
jgi:hypothetical protein